MRNKYWLFLTELAVLFAIIGVIVGIVIHTGANHPPMRFPDINKVTTQFIEEMEQMVYKDASLSLSSQGPFKWDNEKDLGFSDLLGEWANEIEQDAIVYYRRDKDAAWQEKALSVISSVDQISEELSDMIGRICCSANDANGRRIPVYLPESAQEYTQVLGELCNGLHSPSNKNGCSIINIGPLGCKNSGIVLHPDSFDTEEDYLYVLRKEMARYAYLSSVDFCETINHQSWFTEGFLEYFARPAHSFEALSESVIDFIEDGFDLSAENIAMGEVAQQAGAAFFDYFVSTQGEESFSRLIQDSFTSSLDSVFVALNLDFEQIKQDWLQTIRGTFTPDGIDDNGV